MFSFPQGESRVDPHIHPHESPKVMTMPLVILAGLATIGGILGIPLFHGWHILHNWLEPVLHFDLAHALEHSEHMLHEAGRHAPSWAHLLNPKEHNLWLEIFLMAFSACVGYVIAGWSSNNNWSLLGSMRTALCIPTAFPT